MTSQPAVQTIAFGSLRIEFDERVLRPRPWTVAQSLWASELIRTAPPGDVLELCAGAGQIGLLAVTGTGRRLVCVDADPVACDYARHNARAAAADVEVRSGSMDEVLADDEEFALVIADPPWVRSSDVDCFPADPQLAIDGGADGLDGARECVAVARRHLRPGGALLLQLGDLQQAVAIDQIEGVAVVELRRFERGVLVRLGLDEHPVDQLTVDVR